MRVAMESDRDLRRLKTFSRGSSILLLLITVLLVVSAATLAIGIAAILMEPSSFTDEFGMTPGQIAVFGIGLVVAMGLIAATFAILFWIMHSISREYSPFTAKNVRRLTVLSAIFVIIPALLTASMVSGMTDLGAALVIALIAFIPFLLVAATIYMLALVFRYGCFLQRESDETL